MAELKTKENDQSVDAFLATVEDMQVLETLIQASVAHMRATNP